LVENILVNLRDLPKVGPGVSLV